MCRRWHLQPLAGFGVRDVARDDAAVRTRAVDASDLNACFFCETASERRRKHAGVAIGLRSGRRRLRRGRWCGGFLEPLAGRRRRRRSGRGVRGGRRGCFRGRRRRGTGGLHILAIAGQDRDDVVDGNVLRALGHQDLRDRAFIDGFDFHRRLVGLDLRDHVAGLDGKKGLMPLIVVEEEKDLDECPIRSFPVIIKV